MTDSDLLSKKNELISFVETILQEIKSPAQTKDHMAVDDRSFSGHDSVMLGEISPHHEYLDSKSSTETPPSYNQLNYHDNIERFFKSNIGVTVNNGPYGSDEENLHSTTNSSDEPGKNNTSRPALQCTSSTNESGNSGSAENLSSESNNLQSFGSQGETSNTSSNNSSSNGGVKPPILTESILNRHNEDMEKLMIQKHREQKKGDKRNKSSLNDQKTKTDQPTPRAETNNNKKTRLKRSGSKNWEADNTFNKISKYDDQKKVPQNVSQLPNTLNTKFIPAKVEASTVNVPKSNPNPNFNINVWPSASMAPNTATAHQCYPTPSPCPQTISRFSMFPQMVPVYYVPLQQTRRNTPLSNITQEHTGPPNPLAQSAPYCYAPYSYIPTPMPNVMYPPMIGPTSATPTAMMYGSFLVPETPMTILPQTSYQAQPGPVIAPSTTPVVNQSSDLNRPNSQATSEKAEPGSTMAMSESSKKIYSPSAFTSSCTDNDGGYFFSSSINKSCNSSSNTDQRHTLSSFESSLSNLCSSNNQSSYHKSEKSMGSQTRKALGMMRREPPWIEGVSLTPELVYQYQLNPKSLNEVLKSDLEFLKHSKQPNLVNDQLGQLFIDLDLEGFGSKLKLDEQGTNSASDSSSDGSQSPSRVGAW